jgi:hypothetical protein
MAAAGMGPRLIAKVLNERGVPAWGRWRKPTSTPTWEVTYVRLILRQPSVEGDYVPGFSNTKATCTKFTDRIVSYYPRIVDADLVARARQNLDSRKLIGGPEDPRVGSGGRHVRNVANLFAGMVTCGECGNRMHLRTNGEKPPTRHWQCNFASRKRGCGQTTMFRYVPFELSALNAVLHLALDDKFFAAAPDRTGGLVVQLAEIEKAIADRQAQATRLAKVMARMDDVPEVELELHDIHQQRRTLESQREKVAEALQAARGAVSPAEHLARVRAVRDALHDPSPDVRRAARMKVQAALRDLGCAVVCTVFKGERMIVLSLADGSFVQTFANDGTVTGTFDPVATLDRAHPESSPETIARLADRELRKVAGDILGKMGQEPPSGLSGPSSPSFVDGLAVHVRRHRERAK